MGASENLPQTIQATVQYIVASDVRELKVRMSSLENNIQVQFDVFRQQSEAQYKALMATIQQIRAT